MKRLGFDALNEEGFLKECMPVTISKEGATKEVFGYAKSGDEVILSNGFYPIQYQIYDIQRARLYKLYHTLNAVKVKPVAVNTDCLFYNSTAVSDKAVLGTGLIDNKFGGYKLELDKNVKPASKEEIADDETFYKSRIDEVEELEAKKRRQNLFVSNFEPYQKVLIDTEEYWDDKVWNGTEKEGLYLNELKAKFKDNTLVTARFAGCGKSTALKMCLPKETTLFVTPYNVLALEIMKEGFQATTMNKLLGKGVDEGDRVRRYDVNSPIAITHIVFDEVYSYNIQALMNIWKYMSQYSGTTPQVRIKKHKPKAKKKEKKEEPPKGQLPPTVDLDDFAQDLDTQCNECFEFFEDGLTNGYCADCVKLFPQILEADEKDNHTKEAVEETEVEEEVKVFRKISFCATGDILQLHAIDVLEDNTLSREEQEQATLNRVEFIGKVINKMFPNNIHLTLMKRFAKGNADAEKLFNLIFDELKEGEEDYSGRIKQIIETFKIPTVQAKNVTTTNNISYFNPTAITVNRLVRSNLKMGKLQVGHFVVCKNSLKTESGKRLCLNSIYKITDLNVETFSIEDELLKLNYTFPIEYLNPAKDYFRSPFCRTCHSIQGLTMKIKKENESGKKDFENIDMDDRITVFDLDKVATMDKSIVPHWLYVVFTRGETMNQYQVGEKLGDAMVLQGISGKIAGHIEEDTKKGRLLEDTRYSAERPVKKKKVVKEQKKKIGAKEETKEVEKEKDTIDTRYVTEWWVWSQLEQQQYCCNICFCELKLTWETAGDGRQYTIGRVKNGKGHYMSNCTIECWDCNRKKEIGGAKHKK